MAFYTSRVDDDGNEIERRHSARSIVNSMSGGSTRMNMSSRSCETKSSVRYVNPAAFIEKTSEHSDTSSISNSVGEGKYLPQNASPKGEQTSDIVPPLDLQSEENYPTTRDYTFSYRKHCEAAKIVLKPDLAYETWLSAKRKLISDEAIRRKRAEEQKRKEQAERKRLAEEKFKKWLEAKSRPQTRSREKIKSNGPAPSHAGDIEEKRSKPQISEEEAQARREEWERAKQLEEERRRALKRQQEEHRREMEEQRRSMATEAWEKWLADADKKPKPVPLNRGIFTLRGTISDIFVNPNEWQSTIPIKNDN